MAVTHVELSRAGAGPGVPSTKAGALPRMPVRTGAPEAGGAATRGSTAEQGALGESEAGQDLNHDVLAPEQAPGTPGWAAATAGVPPCPTPTGRS